jgi:hypothetical protein
LTNLYFLDYRKQAYSSQALLSYGRTVSLQLKNNCS